MNKMIFCLVCIFSSFVSQAQFSLTEMQELITNGKSRDWQLADYRKTLGNECRGNGQLFTFFKTGKVQLKKCINNKVEFKEFMWNLVPVGQTSNGEWKIELTGKVIIDEQVSITSIRIDLPLAEKNKPNKRMIWREFPGCKACPQQNLTLISKN